MTDDPVALLREAADKATPGRYYSPGSIGHMFPFVAEAVEGLLSERAALESEVVRLRAQVEAVRALHRPITEVTSVPGYRDPETTWTRCGSNNCNPLVWPCDTIRALGGSDE